MPYLEIHDLLIAYGKTIAVDGITLEIEKGEFFTLLGPSGCGKTSTLRAIAGFVTPARGDIRLGNRSIVQLKPYERNVSMVFQSLALFPHMTVFDNVAYGMRMRGGFTREEIRRRVHELLELVQLPGFADRYPHQLSGGQQQRVALARALATHPDILLLDEPLGALDRKLREELQVELRRIHDEVKTTTILVTHDQREAMGMSHRIAVMRDGHIEQVGTPEELYKRPKNRFVADFIGRSNLFQGRVLKVSDSEISVQIGSKFTIICTPSGLDATKVHPGDLVYVAIRPESIALAREPQSHPGALPSTITFRRPLGSSVEYYLSAGEGLEIVAEVPSYGEAATYEQGERVYLMFEPESIRLLKD